jgi:hypothetical protein
MHRALRLWIWILIIHPSQQAWWTERFLQHLPEKDELTRDSFGSPLFAALNQANLQDCAVIVAQKGQKPSQPIQVLYVSTSDALVPSCSHPRLLYLGEEGSSLNLIQSFVGNSKDGLPYLTNSIVDLHLEKDSSLFHVYSQVSDLYAMRLFIEW